MKKQGVPSSHLTFLSERLGQLRRTMFLLETGERLKWLRDPRRVEALRDPDRTSETLAHPAVLTPDPSR